MPLLAYVFVRIRTPEMLHSADIAKRVSAGIVFSIIIWFIYGITCLFTPRKKSNRQFEKDYGIERLSTGKMNVLYKYCDQRGIVRILGSLELKLPYIAQVNEPLEGKPFFYCPNDKVVMGEQCLRTFERNGISPPADWEHKLNELYETGELRKMLEKGMRDFIREWNQRSCLLSVSKTAEEPVMWAHYAEAHKGAAIGIDFDKLFKVHRVKYPKDRHRPRLNLLHEFTIEKAWEIASTKSASWDYEEEFRSLFDDATLRDLAHQDLTCLRDFNGKKTWFLRLNPASIREVVFGLYTDESLKLAIRKLIERPELQHVKLYQAEESETYTFNLKEWT